MRTKTLLALPLCLAFLAVTTEANAGGTRTFRAADFDELDDGEVDGAAVEAPGRVTVGFGSERTEVDSARSVFTCLADGKQAFIGTADEATIQKVSLGNKGGPTVEKLAKLDGAVVSAIAPLGRGELVAATLPGGELFRVDKKGKVTSFAKLDKVDAIWAIVPHRGRLLVGTGPSGELWSVSMDGKDKKVVLDIPEKHVLSVLPIDGKILVGSSPKARLYQVSGDKEGILVHDFKGDEVRALAFTGRNLLAAVNDFEDRGLSSVQSLEKQLARSSLSAPPAQTTTAKATVPDAKATLWRVDLGQKRDLDRAADAAWVSWLQKEKQYFTDVLAVDDRGTVLVSSSKEGKVYRVRGQRSRAVVADLEERQTTALCGMGNGRVLATASDGAAVYDLLSAPARAAKYTTEVFDAEQPASYGRVTLLAKGKIELRARTGPGDEPDDRWSKWKQISLARGSSGELRGKLDLARRRYVQLQVSLLEADAVLDDIEFFYAPENLAPLLTEVDIEEPDFDIGDDDEPKPKTTVKWKVDARDDDDLVYDVAIRPAGKNNWLVLNEEPTDKKELEVDLETIPDGTYEIEVRASDEPSNGTGRASTDKLKSRPFVVDRTRPVIEGAQVDGRRVTGVAKDVGSHIHDVSFRVDRRAYRSASPTDGIFDSETERFEAVLPEDLGPGQHRLVLRARDAHGNIYTIAKVIE